MEQLLSKLVAKIRDEKEGLEDILEAYIYKMVFEIPTPLKDKRAVIYDGVKMVNVDTQELPYVSDDFFRTLFSEVTIDTVVRCFTHMLCQTPTIIAAKELKSLVPIH
jgi:hypothetical protein